MGSDTPIRSYDIPGGLRVFVLDDTNHYFGGYFHVKLRVSVEIGLSESWFDSLEAYQDAVNRLGKTVMFSKLFEKMGVPKGEITSVRDSLLDTFETNTLPYFNHNDFAQKYALVEYRKATESAAKAFNCLGG